MKENRKTILKWSQFGLTGAVALSLVACSSGSGGGAAADPDDDTPITIQYWHAHADNQMPGVEYMIEEFTKKYPHITVEPVYQGGYADLHKKLQAAVVANDVPAVTNVEVASLPNFADSGTFADLTSWIERDGTDLDDFAEGMLQAYAYDGVQYGFPLIVSTSVFVYNKTLLDELGVKPPETWDEIEDFMKKVAVIENGETKRYAFSVPGWDTWYYDPWVINGGGSILNDDHTEVTIHNPESMRYLLNFKKWQDEGYMHMGFGRGASDIMRQMFLDGQIAMVQHSSAVIKTYLENADFEVGVAFIPGDAERISNIGGAGIVMMEKAKANEKEAAWKFIEHMTSAEHNIRWAELVGYLPTRKSAFTSEEGEQYFQNQPQYAAVFDNFDSVMPRLQHPAYPEFSNVYKEVIGEMVLNGADPEPLMQDAAVKIQEILEDYR
ncbi:ABC transporter substrate-binding protein [Paenibacillus senegalensis]|uniref:ABC transporter substrate-binding protein n=1 Tax=Paenibacillus senegalensis TaxID=1465766 RepID=UPI0002880942|nr:ABC transporter substrate-binding protein [Paenibacillus senegalensis]